ncbi:hypothetical protein niasHT_017132 [Heterodera trifolii]|uniref:Uncharacterized protein n=1 Tax=Heterodera trifolii TaxID=157864 RepID=A0ABD2LER3_9BILA
MMAKEFRLWHNFERSFPDAPPPRAPPRLAQQNSRTPCPIDFKFHRPSINNPQCRTAKEFRLRHHFERSFPDAPPPRAPPRLAQQNSRTPCPIDFKFYRPSINNPQFRTAKEFRLWHNFERSFPDAPPPRAPPRLAQQNSRTPSESRKNFASGTILSEVFPTPRPLAHPRDSRSKTRAPLVRLTSNFTGHHSTIPLAESRKNFASTTILSEVFPTPRPLAHPRDLRSKTRAPLSKEFRLYHHFERSFPDAPPPRAPPRLAQQNSRTPCPIDFKFHRPSINNPQCRMAEEFRLSHHFERSFPDAPPPRAPPRLAQQNSRTPCPIDFKFYTPSFHHPLS